MNARVAPLSVLVVATALGAYAGFEASRKAPPASAPVAVEPPVPAPAHLVAEVACARPDATWHKVQSTVGGVLTLAPPTFRELLAAVAGVPALAGVIDDGSPAFGAVSDSGGWVLAARAVSAQRARSTLETDPASALRVEAHQGKMDVLAATRTWLGLAGAWVIVGSDRDALTSLGPYAYRSLPARPAKTADVTATIGHAALAGPIRAALDARRTALRGWLLAKDEEQRRDHGGRQADLADPRAVVAELDRIAETYERRFVGMDRADVALDLDDDVAHLKVTLAAPPAGDVAAWVDELDAGPTGPLVASSGEALATMFWRAGPAARARTAKEASDALARFLGDRVPAGDEAELGAALDRIAAARGDWALLSVTGGAESGALLRLETADASSVAASLASLVDVARKPSWAKWVSGAFGVTKITRNDARATFEGSRGTLQAAWSSRRRELDVAAGVDANAVLASAEPAVLLGSDAKVAAWLRSLGEGVVWATVARPLVLASSPRSDPVVLALVRGHHAVTLDAHASSVLVRELAAVARGP